MFILSHQNNFISAKAIFAASGKIKGNTHQPSTVIRLTVPLFFMYKNIITLMCFVFLSPYGELRMFGGICGWFWPASATVYGQMERLFFSPLDCSSRLGGVMMIILGDSLLSVYP